ncbi:SRPBCC family protein [Streptomyces sp. NPDC086787]|uniref:SRPBCC family protein n=1 Tax=Streptomyces sp. NPDC086787 TaxID=3365759 RepID=UPI00380AF620
MTAELTGTCLTLGDDRPAIRFSRAYDQSVEQVWRFVTEPDRTDHWFPSRLRMELRPGGTAHFSGDPHQADDTGTVLDADPPRHLSFTWGGDELHLDLEALDTGRSRLTLTNILGAANAAARNAAGWEVCLLALDAVARGERHGGPHSADAADWHHYYRAYLDAGFPSGAPVPDPG